MPENDSLTQLVDRSDALATNSVYARSAVVSVPLDRGTTAASPRHRQIIIDDERFPSGRAHFVAWTVVRQGQQDLSTWLCRSAAGETFLLCRSGNRPDLLPAVVPLSAIRAATWLAAHPRHIGDWNQPFDHPEVVTTFSSSPAGDAA